jgi:hypothetical protein
LRLGRCLDPTGLRHKSQRVSAATERPPTKQQDWDR